MRGVYSGGYRFAGGKQPGLVRARPVTRAWCAGALPMRTAGPTQDAAEFLRQFVDDVALWRTWTWPARRGHEPPYVGKGASGFGTRALIELARRTAG